jgi:choline dehydrogenase-like flavoprotein
MSDITIIVGGTGGAGSALARRLVAAGRKVHLVGRDPVRLQVLASELGATSAVADVLDAEALHAAIEAAGPSVAGLAYMVGSINLKPVSSWISGSMRWVPYARCRLRCQRSRPLTAPAQSCWSRRWRWLKASRLMPRWRWPREQWKA